jgi:hypothetical protein
VTTTTNRRIPRIDDLPILLDGDLPRHRTSVLSAFSSINGILPATDRCGRLLPRFKRGAVGTAPNLFDPLDEARVGNIAGTGVFLDAHDVEVQLTL